MREAFKDLLKGWARSHDLVFVPEYEIAAPTRERRYVDGALLHALRMPFGYWEAKQHNRGQTCSVKNNSGLSPMLLPRSFEVVGKPIPKKCRK